MAFTQLYAVCFSPTGSSRKAAKKIASAMKGHHPILIDFTLPQNRNTSHTFLQTDLVILSLPVYGGRIPEIVQDALEKLTGKNTPVILSAVYGNRHYDDALLEMADIMTKQGFRPIAAGAFSVQHCKTPFVGTNRPNEKDEQDMVQLGKMALELLEKGVVAGALNLPGNRPYKERKPKNNAVPIVGEGCTRCGACIRTCPVGAINENNPHITDGEKCIQCNACEKICPVGTRRFTDEHTKKIVQMLEEKCKENRSNELFVLK
ncbi:MAG: EFR1 family ferrodoxin [Oscillospiraceae bacterium]|nr:EFR1 family ferrodoxin [Oscillospiraceae bacterium]